MSGTDAASPGLQDAGLLLDLFRRSSLKQLELRAGAFAFGVSREGSLRPPREPAPAGEVLRAPHIATLTRLAAAGEVVPPGHAYATLEVLGVETPLTRDADTRVLAVFATPGDLVEFDTPLIEHA